MSCCPVPERRVKISPVPWQYFGVVSVSFCPRAVWGCQSCCPAGQENPIPLATLTSSVWYLKDNIEGTIFFVFSPLCSGRLARIANGMAVAEHYAPFVRRFLPVLNDLSLTVKLEQQDRHENNCALRKCNCCSNNNHYSRNLEKSYPQFRGQFCRSVKVHVF